MPLKNTFKEYKKTFWNRIQLQTNEPSTNTHQHQKISAKTPIHRIKSPTTQHLELHPMDISRHTTTRWSTKSNLDIPKPC